ncbi:MAG: hypothetical protein QNJ90_03040 [Planctomycetota bacterium]|nr:hypothetical protein [Planctomycetota bacterium]
MPSAPEAPESSTKSGERPGDKCPCCKRGGWIRDLPPQAQAVQLEPLVPAFLDLPAPELWDAPALPEQREVLELVHAPPDDPRPHAAPVGIVRLNT